MGILVRRIARGEWSKGIENTKDLPFKAITDDLHSKDNSLSTWRVNSLDDIDSVLLAIALQGKFIGTVNAVYFDENEIGQLGISMIETKGNTGYVEVRDNHRDLVELRYENMDDIVNLIIKSMREEKVKKLTEGQINKKIKHCYENHQIDMQSLTGDLQSAIIKLCESSRQTGN